MRLSSILLVVAAANLVSCDAMAPKSGTKVSMANTPRSTSVGLDAVKGGRFLRSVKTTYVDDDEEEEEDDEEDSEDSTDAVDTEERVLPTSVTTKLAQLESKISHVVSTERSFWGQMQQVDDVIKQKMKLQGLSSAALKSNQEYQTLKYAAEGVVLNKMFNKGVTPSWYWDDLGLATGAITATNLKSLEKTAEYQSYLRYAQKYDDAVYNNKPIPSNGVWTADELATSGKLPGEYHAFAQIWGTSGRPKDYVLKQLGLTQFSANTVKKAENYKYYLEYLKALP
ncbi:hypothetical protein PHYBOEH_011577 [Phytophthora boehmeriae]|uniref:RxLR effector protein n=1 Tax=Phytophthora boehmeriae TaxID=109152 RepID=A0A8T1VL75_9STRA|nr:hypothetical protein PHYBOEH_011577 [Phytophthora boehmeriae]